MPHMAYGPYILHGYVADIARARSGLLHGVYLLYDLFMTGS